MPRYLSLLQYDAEGSKSLLQEEAVTREAAFRARAIGADADVGFAWSV